MQRSTASIWVHGCEINWRMQWGVGLGLCVWHCNVDEVVTGGKIMSERI